MVNHKYKFIYTRITKTASETVRYALKDIKGDTGSRKHFHILDEINPRTEDYFKFTFVRNPWARLVSTYFYRLESARAKWFYARHKNYSKGKSTFAEFARSSHYLGRSHAHRSKRMHPRDQRHLKNLYIQNNPIENQLGWISDDKGVVLTDFVGKVENLQEDFDAVCDKIGIPRKKLLHKNRSKHKHYTKYYDDETRQIVAEKYAKDIEYFGYEFGT